MFKLIIDNLKNFSNSSGPWGGGPWGGNNGNQGNGNRGNSSGGKDNSSNSNNNNSKNTNNFFKKNNNSSNNNNDSDDFITKIIKQVLKFFNDFSAQSQNPTKAPKSGIGIMVLIIILTYLSFGFYKVDPDENAVTLYFGKFYRTSEPGLNYHIPYPFGQVIKKSVTNVNTEEFGFSSTKKLSNNIGQRNFNAESLMLTGDENIVDIQFQVQWQIANIKDFVFNIAEPNQSIRKSSESAMREIIARTPIAQALSDGKMQIEQDAKNLLQEILDSYNAGIRIVLVQLRRVDPPEQVIDAFRDVQTAKADKEKEINQAQAFANDIIPRSRGTASQMKEEAEAYSKQVVANAQGEASRFLAVYNEYVKAKEVTKRRIYLETMEKIYGEADKIYIDKSASSGSITPYFPLNDINKTNKPLNSN
ncbi:MAG: FtsH protease activity modulator HflK [Proteobacteria bacterium]|nr:FtsH protease activity modulator HflK [Pseudomonadota bacterium]NCA27678.1 FtsH protease activity modulator HflK [Pseudomonadota bacterium]